MDTLKEKQWLESLHESGQARGQLWRPRASADADVASARLRLMLPVRLGRAEARPSACSRSAPTPTTSRSAAAARILKLIARRRDREHLLGRPERQGERAEEARASAEAMLDGVPEHDDPAAGSSATASSRTTARDIKEFFEDVEGATSSPT